MEPSERTLVVTRENPRGGAGVRAPSIPATAGTQMLDKFRALVKQREEEIFGEAAELSSEDVVRVYEALLVELTLNSKPIITDLTIIAGEQREHGQGIADAICNRIVEAPVDQKLPSLYLLDSIVKNIGKEYVRYFSSRLPEVFCKAYTEIQPNLYPSMRHLFGTWSSVFPSSVLHKIESRLQFSSQNNHSSGINSLRASESPRPVHGIHVNPKYLRQMDNPNADNNKRGTSSLHDDYDSDHTNIMPTHVRNQRLTLIGGSPQRNSTLEFGLDGASGRDGTTKDWRRKRYPDEIPSRFGSIVPYLLSSGEENLDPRALINAYGDDRRKRTPVNKPLPVEHLNVNGISNKVGPRSWQSTEEEEFDWEDMSPTLADRGRILDTYPSSIPPYKSFGERPGIQNIQSGHPHMLIGEDAYNFSDQNSGHGLTSNPSQVQRSQNQFMAPRYPQSGNLHHNLPHLAPSHHARLRGDQPNSLSGNVLPSSSGDTLASAERSQDSDFHRPPGAPLNVGSAIGSDTSVTWSGSVAPGSVAPGSWPSINTSKSHLSPGIPVFPHQKQIGRQFDPVNASGSSLNQGPHRPSFMSEQYCNSLENKDKQSLLSSKNSVMNLQNQSSSFVSQLSRDGMSSSGVALMPPYSLGPQRHNPALSLNPAYSVPSSIPFPINSNPNTFNPRLGIRPPLPPGPPHMMPIHQNGPIDPNPVAYNQVSGGAFSGLISSLMDQGLISAANQTSVQDSLGLVFDADLLKLRHESAISALYSDLPRQCTTCGLRFKCQEEHSSHMDWHVTKNRNSKSRKQKPSRKWFVSSSMWLTGAEALGSEAVPGFLPTETVVEKKDDEELAVPADEEQTTCALCGEAFDDFYSDETEEWMYRGSVYVNAPNGSVAGMVRSQLGPIVHAKCRPESDVGPSRNFGLDEWGNTEEGSQRKRQRN